jgi:myosin heavy subunit
MANDKVDNGWSTIDLSADGAGKKVEFEIEGQEDKSNEQKKAQTAPETNIEVTRTEESSDTRSNNDTAAVGNQSEAQPNPESKELEGIETRGAQKRIRQLIKQRKEREEEISRLRDEVEKLRTSVQVREKELSTSIKSTIESTESQLKTRIDSAKDLFKRAAESSDTDGMLKAQEEMSRAYAEMTQVRQRRQDLEEYTNRLEAQQTKETPAQNQQKQGQYDPKAIQWASKNEWFGKDQIMTNAALLIDAQLKEEGFDPSDDEYYDEVDSRLSRQFPQKFKDLKVNSQDESEDDSGNATNATKAASRPSQVVSGASRTSKASTTSRGNKVKLTQEDVRLAQKWGIPLERYAAEKLKAEQANGDYTPI